MRCQMCNKKFKKLRYQWTCVLEGTLELNMRVCGYCNRYIIKTLMGDDNEEGRSKYRRRV